MSSADVYDELQVVEKQPVLGDYWTSEPTPQKWFFPDGVQFLEFEPLRYGKRMAYQTAVAQDLNVNRRDQSIKIRTNMARDSHELILISTINWYIFRDGKPVAFSKGSPGANLDTFLRNADAVLIDHYLDVVRKANPWLLNESSSKEIQEEIDQLQVALEEALEREAGK